MSFVATRMDLDMIKLSEVRKVKVKSFSPVRLFETLWTIAYQAPPSMGFSRQEYWSGLPFPSPGDLPDPGIKPRCPAFQADASTSKSPGKSERERQVSHDVTHMWNLKYDVKITQSCLSLCDHMDCSPEILQARILEWVAFPFSRGSSQARNQT